MTWWVLYEVEGHGALQAGPYTTEEEAESHRRDIAAYQGVKNARLALRETPVEQADAR